MKNFELTPDMLTIGGVFYPRGYAVVMFPSVDLAQKVASEIEGIGNKTSSDIMLLTPADVIRSIGQVKDDSDVQLPSVGTEGATVRKYVEYARQGHHGLMVAVDSSEAAESLMQAARKASFSYGQRYQLLAIQDLE